MSKLLLQGNMRPNSRTVASMITQGSSEILGDYNITNTLSLVDGTKELTFSVDPEGYKITLQNNDPDDNTTPTFSIEDEDGDPVVPTNGEGGDPVSSVLSVENAGTGAKILSSVEDSTEARFRTLRADGDNIEITTGVDGITISGDALPGDQFLQKSENLNDVADILSARSNLLNGIDTVDGIADGASLRSLCVDLSGTATVVSTDDSLLDILDSTWNSVTNRLTHVLTIRKPSNQVFNNASETTITNWEVISEQPGFVDFDPATGSGTILSSGMYFISGTCLFNSPTANATGYVRLQKNSQGTIQSFNIVLADTSVTTHLTGTESFASDDTFALAIQSFVSGGANDFTLIGSNTNLRTSFSFFKTL